MTEHDSIKLTATVDNLDKLLDWLDDLLFQCGFDGSSKVQLDIAVEEIYINISNYAYDTGEGDALVSFDAVTEPLQVTITFEDHGKHYDPLAHKDPDVDLPISKRTIGGLGIYMTKQYVDEASYEYKDGKNILKLVKKYTKDNC